MHRHVKRRRLIVLTQRAGVLKYTYSTSTCCELSQVGRSVPVVRAGPSGTRYPADITPLPPAWGAPAWRGWAHCGALWCFPHWSLLASSGCGYCTSARLAALARGCRAAAAWVRRQPEAAFRIERQLETGRAVTVTAWAGVLGPAYSDGTDLACSYSNQILSRTPFWGRL